MIEKVSSLYRPRFARAVVYMLQATEYDPVAYLKWCWRTDNFGKVAYRRNLVMTKAAKALLVVVQGGIVLEVVIAIGLFLRGISDGSFAMAITALALLVLAPVLWSQLVVLFLLAGNEVVIKPRTWILSQQAAEIFKTHKGLKIAVAGSYGKTTTKEILRSVLGQGKKVAATPANKNVAISHAIFAKSLSGDEQVLIIEYGEGAPGDVGKFADVTKPDVGIITGLTAAHLDKYGTIENAGQDIFSLTGYVPAKKTYVNNESKATKPFIKSTYNLYDSHQAAGWKISDVKNSISGVSFIMKKQRTTLRLKSSLIGRHQVGTLALAAALAVELGLPENKIKSGIAKTEPFEHRMQPFRLSGAWIIDDTYNGNIEGMRAGLALLAELPAKRKIYVTPGLVDQGQESADIHQELGRLIAGANPDLVILIKHSVTEDIQKGLEQGGFKGKVQIETDPLHFYNNLEHFVAAGDLVLMQNDWPDNYN